MKKFVIVDDNNNPIENAEKLYISNYGKSLNTGDTVIGKKATYRVVKKVLDMNSRSNESGDLLIYLKIKH